LDKEQLLKEQLLRDLPESIALIIPISELKSRDQKLMHKLFESQDVVKMLDHERDILEWFMKCSFHGYMAGISGSGELSEPKQLTIF